MAYKVFPIGGFVEMKDKFRQLDFRSIEKWSSPNGTDAGIGIH